MTVERAHLSIGEVLALLQPDFPDVTISKIRFLESQGLLVPERTPSGYRKFHDEDIERLRWILTQQRDHFLPLKVIKDRLAAGDLGTGPPDGVLPFTRETGPDDGSVGDGGVAVATDASASVPTETVQASDRRGRAALVGDLVEGPAPKSAKRTRKRHPTGHTKGEPTPTAVPDDVVDEDGTSFTRAELSQRSGLDGAAIDELERYGLLATRTIGDDEFFDEDALAVALLAGGFARFGIEPRHLRMYRVSAEREAGLFEQLIMPLLKQRRAAAREEAVVMLEELAELADDLRAVMVRSALRDYLGRA